MYRVLQRTYYRARYVTERIVGTRLNELVWQAKGIDRAGGGALEHPHRAFLVERIGRPVTPAAVLEVGCNAGHNLLVLSRRFPGVRLSGIDISDRAVRAARETLAEHGITDAHLVTGSASDLGAFSDASVDVGFSDATLMYVGPDQIRRALAELVRVTRHRVMLNEWHFFGRPDQGSASWWYDAHWVHDYVELLKAIPRVTSVRAERLPADLWGGGGWLEHGALIEANIA